MRHSRPRSCWALNISGLRASGTVHSYVSASRSHRDADGPADLRQRGPHLIGKPAARLQVRYQYPVLCREVVILQQEFLVSLGRVR
jgi:hypothetical protein